jgi:sugar transferase (PEP-CTERM/EpsH1 system associated)
MLQTLIQEKERSPDLRQSPSLEKTPPLRRLRILHVIPQLMPGGTEYALLRLICALGDEEFEHGICATRGVDVEFVRRQMVTSKVFCVGAPGARYQFPFFRLVQTMRSLQPDVVHSRNWGGIEAVPAARLTGVPVVVHSEHGYELDSTERLPYRRRIFRQAVYAMADSVFTNSCELRDYHARQAWVSADTVRVICNGVDTDRFKPEPSLRQQLREELRIPKDSLLVGSVGRLVTIKDHVTLLKAVSSLAGQGLNLRVLLVGAGPEMEKLQRHAAEDANIVGRVIFTGASDRVPELLNAMDVFVLPSRGEGMSNTLLEAMATALPVVASRVGGNPELIEHGCTGFLFMPAEIANLAGALMRLYDRDVRQQVGTAARERVILRFSLERMVRDYRDLYRGLAARKQVS